MDVGTFRSEDDPLDDTGLAADDDQDRWRRSVIGGTAEVVNVEVSGCFTVHHCYDRLDADCFRATTSSSSAAARQIDR